MSSSPSTVASLDLPVDFGAALDTLRELCRQHSTAVVLTHDNPDPDAMASAAGLSFLFAELGGLRTQLAYGGIIGRAENRALVRHLKLPMTPISKVHTPEDTLWALVDTQPPTGNHSLPAGAVAKVVVDHHPERPGAAGSPLWLISNHFGATSTMVTLLIHAAGLEPNPMLATALFYGVKSDTRALGREAGEADTEAYRWLFGLTDPALLAEIEHPQVPVSYFRAYHHAYEQARMRGNVITVDMGGVYLPDIVPEIAERLLSLDGVKWSVAVGEHEDELYVSLRTNDRRMNAGKQIRALTEDLGGSAGGHGQMAGARLPLEGLSQKKRQALAAAVLDRFAENFGVEGETPAPIV
ncbi:MAG: DHHA1 domain-containing protein [Deltaproteobacteria bacterium]|nr:DHHA1 domain-containing protein [Deltaproteobacteria bacterium]